MSERIHWDRAYIRLVLDEEVPEGKKDYEVVLGWKERKLAPGGGFLPVAETIPQEAEALSSTMTAWRTGA